MKIYDWKLQGCFEPNIQTRNSPTSFWPQSKARKLWFWLLSPKNQRGFNFWLERLNWPECPSRCDNRCSNTQYRKPCLFFCQKCCRKCLCVPPGFYGNKGVCPCYNNWKTKEGGPKCPWTLSFSLPFYHQFYVPFHVLLQNYVVLGYKMTDRVCVCQSLLEVLFPLNESG